MRRAMARRSSGAPMAMMVEAPLNRASAMALRPTAPVPCTRTRVAGPERRALEDVDGGEQAAAAADVVVEADRVGEAGDADAGLEVDRLRPAAEQAVIGRVGDAVDASGTQRVGVRCTVQARQRPQVR